MSDGSVTFAQSVDEALVAGEARASGNALVSGASTVGAARPNAILPREPSASVTVPVPLIPSGDRKTEIVP
ncbi:hypothetical protein HB775_21925 [Rhizobium leguminosarum bv. trifolii]|nr:hypothetical protein HB775_21925 [Rhizobium leguminosarum bv. trifolii]